MKPDIEPTPPSGVSTPLSESGDPESKAGASRERAQDSLHEQHLAQLQLELSRAIHDRAQIEAAYRRLSAEYNEEKYRVLRPLWRLILRCGGRVCRLLLPDAIVDQVKTLLPDSEGVPSRLVFAPDQQKKDAETALTVAQVQSPSTKPDVFIFSIITWGFRRQRPQRLAAQFAEHHRVFYVEMLTGTKGLGLWRLADALYRVRLPRRVLGGLTPYSGVASPAQLREFQKTFERVFHDLNVTGLKYLIIQHPYWWQFAAHIRHNAIVIYDCMDDISGFANTTPVMLEWEQQLASASDVLVVSSQALYDKHSGHPARHLIRNACDAAVCADGQPSHRWPRAVSATVRQREQRVGMSVGYVGAIAEWFDFSLIASVAKQNPAIHFHLFGSATTKEVRTIEGIANVTLYGEIHHSDVPAVISNMDVMIIPFRLLPIIQACDPIKFYEHCAMGKPTVATRLPELERTESLVFFASTPEECALQIDRACDRGRDPKFREELRLFAAANTWTVRAAQYEQVLSQATRRSA